jgi:hypothetical protein
MTNLDKLILNQPSKYSLIIKERINGRLQIAHKIELKETLSRFRFDIVYTDSHRNVKFGSGTKTQIFNKLRKILIK